MESHTNWVYYIGCSERDELIARRESCCGALDVRHAGKKEAYGCGMHAHLSTPELSEDASRGRRVPSISRRDHFRTKPFGLGVRVNTQAQKDKLWRKRSKVAWPADRGWFVMAYAKI